MNKSRRKEIEKAQDLLTQAKEIIEICQGEEQEYLDNMPDNLQDGEKFSKADEDIDVMQTIINAIEEFESASF